MNFRLLTFIAVTLLSNVLLLNASSLVLVKNREAKFQIVISPQATVVEKYAAAELQQAVKRASGAEPRIVEGAAEAGFVPVILGTPETTPAIAALDTKLSAGGKLALDEILIHTGDQSLLIGGNNPRSVLYSAYRFLEEAFSYHWFWPGVDGEFFKPSDDCVIDDLNIHENAALKYRSLGINAPHYDEETLIWMARNRLNVHNTHERTTQDKSDNLHEKGFLNRFAGHNLVLPRKLLEEHPEYVAEFGGKTDDPSCTFSTPLLVQPRCAASTHRNGAAVADKVPDGRYLELLSCRPDPILRVLQMHRNGKGCQYALSETLWDHHQRNTQIQARRLLYDIGVSSLPRCPHRDGSF